MNIAVILPAAGQSKRFGGKSKLEATLAGRAVLIRAVELFSKQPDVTRIVVAADPDRLDEFKIKWGDKLGFLGAKVVAGGRKERWETVLNALNSLDDDVTHVAVHDAARPVTDAAMIERVFAAAAKHAAVISAVSIHATVKKVADEPLPDAAEADLADAILGSAGKTIIEARPVIKTIPRDNLCMVQTPQIFKRDLLQRAYQQVVDGKVDTASITDDAGLVESFGEQVVVVQGDPLNVKITEPSDLKFAEAALMARSGKVSKDKLGSKRKFPTWAQSDD